jgi:hypothetical protein
VLSDIEMHHGTSSLHRARKHEKANPLTFLPREGLLMAWYAGLHPTIIQALVVAIRTETYKRDRTCHQFRNIVRKKLIIVFRKHPLLLVLLPGH